MNKIAKLVFTIICLFGLGLSAQTPEKPLIEVQAMVDTSVITIGDRILYTIIIDRQKDLRIEKPGEGLNLGLFEIKAYEDHDPVEYEDRLREQWDFSISVYDTGNYVIPPFPVVYFPSDTSPKFNYIEASAIDIFVNSVLDADGENELKDIKPPLEIPVNYWFWISLVAVALLLALIGYMLYWLWKRRDEKGYLFSPPPPPVPPHVRASEELQALFKSDLLETNQLKEYFIRLSEIIRTYLEGRYEILALEETTLEIIRDTERFLTEEELRKNLLTILSLSDLVKFAKHRPETDTIESTGNLCVEFIERTKPIFDFNENISDNDSQTKDIEENDNLNLLSIKAEE